MRLSGLSGMGFLLLILWGMPAQLEPEDAAAAGAVVEADAAVHQLDQALADGEAQARAALLPRRGGVGLGEAAEHLGAESFRDAGPAVVHADAHRLAARLQRDLDRVALGRELGGVRK